MSDEAFYTDSKGKKRDAQIHNPILAEGDAKWFKSQAYKDTIARAIASGITEEEALRLYGPQDGRGSI